jgi:hypothetical protein
MAPEEIESNEKVPSAEPSIASVDENGQVMIEELAKEFLTKGAWQTVMFLFKERDQRTGEMSDLKVGIRRYQKSKGVLKQRSKFNISSKAQAKQMIEILNRWYPD